MFHSE
jgi:predicted metal-dependent RNase